MGKRGRIDNMGDAPRNRIILEHNRKLDGKMSPAEEDDGIDPRARFIERIKSEDVPYDASISLMSIVKMRHMPIPIFPRAAETGNPWPYVSHREKKLHRRY